MKKWILALCLLVPVLAQAEIKFEDLSFDEKLGQTLVLFGDVDSAEQNRAAIESGKIGGVLIQWGNYSLKQTKELVAKLQSWAAKSPHKIPLLISIDYEGGTVYTPITLGFEYLPTNMMLAATRDEEAAAAVAYLAGLELRRAGVHINFSPVLDVNSNPHNPIIGVRSFGSDPANVTKMGLSLMNGFKASGVVSVVKHFPGHGNTTVDSHYKVPVVYDDKARLEKVHLTPFAEAIRQGVPGVMTGHIMYPALDINNISTFSRPILHDLLRTEMGFKGFVVTDSLDMKSTTFFCKIPDCAVKSLDAGADMLLLGRYIKPDTVFARMKAALVKRKDHSRLEEAAKRMFNLKKDLGLLDGPLPVPGPTDKAFRAALQNVSDKAVTLVRDRRHLLPFKPARADSKKQTVCAVFFAPARFADQLPDFAKPFMKHGWNVRTYNAALTPRAKDSRRAAACAKDADLLVLTSLQWADKTNINQKNAINGLIRENPNTVFISTMSPYDINNYPEADAVLATYGLSRYVLQTAANIILGEIPPLGALPVELEEDTKTEATQYIRMETPLAKPEKNQKK